MGEVGDGDGVGEEGLADLNDVDEYGDDDVDDDDSNCDDNDDD